MRLRAVAVAVALGIPCVALAPFAFGQKGPAPGPAKPVPDGGGAESRYDPDNVTAISQYMETLVKGNERYVAKDYTGAIDLYRKGIQLKPKDPFGPYLLGEAFLATNNLPEAEAAFLQARDLSDSRNPALRSHVLFVVADCFEREKKWTEAKAAWQAYNEHAPKVPDGGAFAASGAERLKVVDNWLKLDAQYEIVRQRIAAEKKDGGGSSGDAGKK
jgi:tetratricopeptide (TPR) repeat protein